jgi:hypothetical protein
MRLFEEGAGTLGKEIKRRKHPLNLRLKTRPPQKVSPTRIENEIENCKKVFDLDQTALLTNCSNLREG